MREPTTQLLAVLLPLILATSVPAQLALDSSVIAGGGGASAGGAYALTGTVGQPDAGAQQSGTGYTLDGGFWATIGGGSIVTNSNDSGPGSLRDVVAAAAPGSTVTFDPSLDGSTIALTTGQIVLDKDLAIDASELGSGIVISGSDTSRIFEVASGQTVHLANLELTNGNGAGATSTGNGGAIYSLGSLVLEDCTLSNNSVPLGKVGGGLCAIGASSDTTALRCTFTTNGTTGGSNGGGAIYLTTSATLDCVECTFSNNLTANTAGAIHAIGSAVANLDRCTFSNNGGPSCGDAGAVRSTNASITVTNSTFTGNNANNNGGAIFVTGTSTAVVSHCTISGNNAPNGGGIRHNGGSLTLDNTIVAGNTATTGPDINKSGTTTLTPTGACLVGINTTVITQFPDGAPNVGGSYVGTAALPVDALLSPLSDNGGLTLTMLPLPGSPAIGTAVASALAIDQRGNPRPSGLLPDIGAVEATAVTTHIASTTNNSVDTWNTSGSWDNGIPAGDMDVIIQAGKEAHANSEFATSTSVAAYSGNLTLEANATLKIYGNAEAGENIKSLGGGTITMETGSFLRFRENQLHVIPNPIFLTGHDAKIRAGESTAGVADLTFTGGITGAYDLLLEGNGDGLGSGSHIRLAAANSFASLTTIQWSGNSWDQDLVVHGDAAGSLGSGNITIADQISLEINAADAMSDRAFLFLDGASSDKASAKLVMNASDTVKKLYIDGIRQPAGTYTNSESWLDGSGTLTVLIDGTLTVANADDASPDSLRDAIASADPGDTIVFDPSLSGQTITLTGGQILLDKSLTIDASGLPSGITLSGNDTSRILELTSGATILLDSVTLTGGRVDGGSGGAINVQSGTTLTIQNSTIFGNTARFSAAINNFGTLTILNSTLANNVATDNGGAIFNNHILTLIHSTVTGNSADYAGGLSNTGLLTLANSVVAGNTATFSGPDFRDLSEGNVIIHGVNLFSDLSASGFSAGPTVLVAPYPVLAPLGDYGGPTWTMPPLPGSPAIEAGVLSIHTPLSDQRGGLRPSGGPNPDLGAVEALVFSPVTTKVIRENFESPDVIATAGDGATDGTLPDNGLWVGSAVGFNASWRGITDTAGGDFSDTSDGTNLQAFAFRYTNSGLTTAEGVIGTLQAGATYSVSFDVVQDLGSSAGNLGLPYIAQLLAYSESSDRTHCTQDSIPPDTTLLTEVTGSATDGVTSLQTVTFQFTPDSVTHAAEFGKDVVFRFMGATNSAIIDNVVIAATTVTPTFVEGFEDPDVTGYAEGTTPDRWVRHSGTFNSQLHGMIDGSTGDFTAEATGRTGNTQAYALRYTASPGITTAEGEIGLLVAGATYSLSFDVQQDLGDVNGSGGNGDWYDASLIAFDADAIRNSGPGSSGQNILVSQIGQIPLDANWHRITLTFTVPYDSPHLGKDVGILFSDVWASGNSRTSAIIDNVELTIAAETIPANLLTIVDNVSGGPVTLADPVVYTVSFDEIMNGASIGTDDFENGGTAGITIDSVSATGDPTVFEVLVTTVSTGELTLQVKSGAIIEDAFGNLLDTSSAIFDDTTILVEFNYDDWIAGFNVGALTGFNDDGDGDGIPNGIESFFGTDPGAFSTGLVATGVSGNTFTFTHPQNPTPAEDVSTAYLWTKDMQTYYHGTDTDGAGTMVTFDAVTNDGTTTVTATVTGTATPRLFVLVQAVRPE